MSEESEALSWFALGAIGLFFLFAMVSFIGDHTNTVGYKDCGEDEVEIKSSESQKLIGSYCVSYSENIDRVLESMDKVDQPVTDSLIAQLTPGLTGREVEALLEKHRDETGEVIDRGFDGWEKVEKVSDE